MELPDIHSDQDGGVGGKEQPGPMAVRLLLGARLRKLREVAGVSLRVMHDGYDEFYI